MKTIIMCCCIVILLNIVSSFSADNEQIEKDIETKLQHIFKNDKVLSNYVQVRLEHLKQTLNKNIIISNSDDVLINLAFSGIETLKMPLLKFESVMHIVDGERFLAHGYIKENCDYIWQLRVCDEYIKASENLFKTYSDLLIIVNDEVNTSDVFDHKKKVFLEEFRKIFYNISHAPIELYKQHMEMAKICRQTIKLLQDNDGRWVVQKNGDLFFQERSVVIELNDLVQIMGDINYKIQDLAEKVDNSGTL